MGLGSWLNAAKNKVSEITSEVYKQFDTPEKRAASAIVSGLALVSMADFEMQDEEHETAKAFWEELEEVNKYLTPDEADDLFLTICGSMAGNKALAKIKRKKVLKSLAELALSSSQKEDVITLAVGMADAEGGVGDDEKAVISEIAAALRVKSPY